MALATGNPPRIAGGDHAEGRGHGLVVFAPVPATVTLGPSAAISYEQPVSTIAKMAEVSCVRRVRGARAGAAATTVRLDSDFRHSGRESVP